MHPNDAARFAPGRSGLATKTRRVSDKFLRKIDNREDFFPIKICHWHFGGWREKQLAILQSVHVLFKFWKLRRPNHAIAPDQKWRTDFKVTMLARVQIEHEIDQRPLQLRARTGETNKPAAAQFRSAFQIEQFQFRSKRDMI